MDIAPSDTRPIEGEQLTAWAVLAGGTHVRMDFIGTDGTHHNHHNIVPPFDALTGLLMTLPRMLQTALDVRFSDDSLRFVQLLGTWQIEQAEANDGLILRLGTRDGFEVAFSLNNRDTDSPGAALVAASDMDQSKTRRPN
jgi:hypothetical protein